MVAMMLRNGSPSAYRSQIFWAMTGSNEGGALASISPCWMACLRRLTAIVRRMRWSRFLATAS